MKILPVLTALVAATAVGLGVLTFTESPEEPTEWPELPPAIRDWENEGKFVEVYGHSMFVMDSAPAASPAAAIRSGRALAAAAAARSKLAARLVRRSGGGGDGSDEEEEDEVEDGDLDAGGSLRDGDGGGVTLVLIHGFPSSSFDYRAVFPDLRRRFARVVAFDHVGFGLSDKPANYSYSLVEQAENVVELCRLLGVRRVAFVAHDMGDSVLTEILARRARAQLPPFLTISGVVFTNGGMVTSLINFRVSQSALLTPGVGNLFAMIARRLDTTGFVTRRQLAGLWGTKSTVDEGEIQHMWQLVRHKNGQRRMVQLIQYINDRWKFAEGRWLPAVASATEDNIPVLLLWGDSDPVSPMTIPQHVASLAPGAKLRVLQGRGHFTMIESPEEWFEEVEDFLEKSLHL